MKDLINLKTAAAGLDMKPRTLQGLCLTKFRPGDVVKIGRRWFLKRAFYDRLIQEGFSGR